MALPSLLLVHGALHAGDCWDHTVTAINRLDPELVVGGGRPPGSPRQGGGLDRGVDRPVGGFGDVRYRRRREPR